MYVGSFVYSILLVVFYVNSFASSFGSERDDRVDVSAHITLPTAITLREEILEKGFKNCLVQIRHLVATHPIQQCFLSYVNEDPDMLWMRRIESYLREAGVQPTYDMRTLGVGDSIMDFIQKIREAHHAVILFSPRYFTNFERGTYIRTEADEILKKWKEVAGFVIPLLLAERPNGSIPILMNRRPKDPSTAVDTISAESFDQQPEGLDTLYIPLTKGSDRGDFEESLECVFRMLKERIFKGFIGADAPSEHDFDRIKRNFDDRKSRIPELAVHTELKATRGAFPQSLKIYNAFFDRTNEIGQSYVDAIFEELFMGHMDERQFATLTICALSGMGGVGKTTLATEFAHKYKPFYEFIYWMDGSSKRDFLSSCLTLLESFGVLVPEQRDVDKEAYFSTIIQMMNGFLPKCKKNWLLVVDNIEESEFVTELTPAGGHVLYTSRNQDWLKRLEIDVFKPDESVAYLLQMTGFDESHKNEAMALAIELDHLPLALAQAAAYITHQRPLSFAEYLAQYKARQSELLAKKQIQPSLNGKYGREAIVMTTWNTTMQKLSSDTQELILYLSYYNSKAIPFETFKFLLDADKLNLFRNEQSPTRLNPRQDIRDSLDELKNYSLINYDNEIASVHNLLQYVVRQGNGYYPIAILEKLIDVWFNFWEEDNLHKKRSKKALYKSYDNLNALMSHCEKLEIEHVKTLI